MSNISSFAITAALVQRAGEILQYLAGQSLVICYLDLARIIGLDVRSGHQIWLNQLVQVLQLLDQEDRHLDRPRRTALVVLKTGKCRGLPSEGFWRGSDFDPATRVAEYRGLRARVHAYSFPKVELPRTLLVKLQAVAFAGPHFDDLESAPQGVQVPARLAYGRRVRSTGMGGADRPSVH